MTLIETVSGFTTRKNRPSKRECLEILSEACAGAGVPESCFTRSATGRLSRAPRRVEGRHLVFRWLAGRRVSCVLISEITLGSRRSHSVVSTALARPVVVVAPPLVAAPVRAALVVRRPTPAPVTDESPFSDPDDFTTHDGKLTTDHW